MAKKGDHAHKRARKDVHPDFADNQRWAPLTSGFMVASIIGFFVSLLYITKFSASLAFAFATVFFCMFIACIISMRRASPDAQLAARPIK
jgi:hypothetical protein